MREYEEAYKHVLPKRMPVIIRIDGKAFHTFLRHAEKPFDANVKKAFDATARDLVNEIDGAVFSYLQSDEINILLNTYSSLGFSPYVGNEVQKLCSVSSSIATAAFNWYYDTKTPVKAAFDSRCFVLPREEVANYFIWRQQDWTRNSVQMTGRAYYSANQLNNKSCNEIQEMLWSKHDINWNDLPVWQRRGRCVYMKDGKPFIDDDIPIFTKDREFIEKFVFTGVDYEEEVQQDP